VLSAEDRKDVDSDKIEFLRKERHTMSILVTWRRGDKTVE